MSENLNNDFLFIDDSDEDETQMVDNNGTWKVLIVDDDSEIHSVTKLALSDSVFLGRRLEYLHAYSGKSACQLIKDNDDIVLVLLDVVMETDDAGLNVVKYIRNVLQRKDIRIVLRTGQPGHAPEESVIKEYDINDYKTKTELTRQKLVTTIFAAIRSFQQIAIVNENRNGLEKIIASTAELSSQHSISTYCHSVLSHLSTLIDSDLSAVFCVRGQGIIENIDDLNLYVIAQIGFDDSLINQKASSLNDQLMSNQIKTCLINQKHLYLDECVSLSIIKSDYRAVIYIKLPKPLTDIQIQLLDVFVASIAVGYENVHLLQKLTSAAYKDWLTNLPNRLDFERLLDDFAQNDSQNTVAALIDINHFSDINNALGQEVGNKLLIAVAKRISHLGGYYQLARVSADVFGIIGSAHDITPNNLIAIFNQPFAAGEQNIPINACFGLCSKENAQSSGVQVLNQINIALNIAKRNRLEYAAYYHADIEVQMQWRLQMIRKLRNDFKNNQLEVWYQPQLSLTNNKVIGAEALLRWRTTDGKFISPSVFIPLAEYSGLILEIGDWVINQACQQIKVLEEEFSHLSLSVNVSIPQFRESNFVNNLISTIEQYKINPSKLELEITENILMDEPGMIVEALTRLKSKGINIALDDFGTGFSSLSYLQKLPLDRLKIDRDFIINITQENHSVIAETIINLGQKMGLKVIAEGIEEIEQQTRLIELGCDEVQGFYYAKPMTANDFITFLHR